MTRASAEAYFELITLQISSLKTQAPGRLPHLLQAMQPLTGLFPIQTVSLSIPSSISVFAISASAIEVLPFWRGLPFIISTFIIVCFCLCEYTAFSLSLYPLKQFVLIFSILLSFLSQGRTEVLSTSISGGSQSSISECPATEKAADFSQNWESCITAAQGYSFSGSDSTYSISGRITQSGKRTSPQVRSAFRMVKGGKIIDNNHLHPFLARSVVHLAGIYISERYLFSICRLRL